MGHSVERLSRTFGIQGTALEWFHSYLKDRMEHVLYKRREVSGENSVVWCAVGVSSCPFLFLLYTADLEIIARRFGVEVHLYADDSQMYVFSRPYTTEPADKRLLHCLDEIARWMQSNRLSLNPSKTVHALCYCTTSDSAE